MSHVRTRLRCSCRNVVPLLIGMLFVIFLAELPAVAARPSSFLKSADYYYTAWTHPVESSTHANFKRVTAVEQQHPIPQNLAAQYKVADDLVVYWIRSNHSVSDRWREQAVPNWQPSKTLQWLTFGNKRSLQNLWRVRTMGTYGIPYSVFFYTYDKDETRLIATHLDGVSNLVYGTTWALNLPQKFLKQIAYILEPGSEPTLWYLVDVLVRLLVLALEIPVALVFTLVGTILGTILHPISTIASVLGGAYIFISSAWIALKEIFVGTWLVVVNGGKVIWLWMEPIGGWRWAVVIVVLVIIGAAASSNTAEEA